MPVDFQRLIDGLSTAASMITDEPASLSAIDTLIAAAQDATSAAGATFVEYGPQGGRVVAATGAMEFARGQPVSPEFIQVQSLEQAYSVKVEALPAQMAEPLAGHGVRALLGRQVQSWGRAVGAIHLYFLDATESGSARPALDVTAAAIAHIYCGPQGLPTTARDDDDRTLFLAVAGHELRTPVTVVKGYASMLADRWESLDEPGRREAARVLMQRADELARLVDRILGASVGDGAMGWLVRVVPFDLVEALLRVVGDLPADLRRSVRLELPNSLPLAHGDPTILISVVAELVTNAVRNTAAKGSMARAETPDRAAQGQVEILAGADANTVFIRVCDRGVGIDPSHVERAFEKFWRARREGEGRGGVGLGLFLVRRLVERQQGWVSLRPRDGGGAVAEIRLPRADTPFRSPVAGEA